MASETAFVGAYRQAVTNFLAAYQALRDLRQQYTALGYGLTDLNTICGTGANADITGQNFLDAVSSMDSIDNLLNNLAPVQGAHLTNLERLKP